MYWKTEPILDGLEITDQMLPPTVSGPGCGLQHRSIPEADPLENTVSVAAVKKLLQDDDDAFPEGGPTSMVLVDPEQLVKLSDRTMGDLLNWLAREQMMDRDDVPFTTVPFRPTGVGAAQVAMSFFSGRAGPAHRRLLIIHMTEQIGRVLDLLIGVAIVVFLILVVQGIRFFIQAMYDARYGRIEMDEGPDSPTSVADF